MVRHFLFVVFFSLLANQAFAVAFEASVDRANIGEGESLTLTLRYNSNVFSGDPDLSPLQQQFTIINQQRKNSFQYIDGKSESWTVWTVTLTPKRKGNLILPSIEYKGERTKPIQINVNKLDPSLKNQQKDVLAKIPKNLPIYVFSGSDDPVHGGHKDIQRMLQAFYDEGLTKLDVKWYPGGRHEMFNETNREDVLADLIMWLDKT